MRIIAGTHRRRVLETPPDASVTRPMPDMVREALFNLLRGHTEGATVFDAFAGTGAIGLEALSRGASRCVFVERDRGIGAMLQRNIDTLGMGERAEVVVGDALGIGALARCPRPVHLVFFDPPYPLVRSAPTWARVREQFARSIALLDDTGYAMLRTPWPFVHEEEGPAPPPVEPGTVDRRRKRKGRNQTRSAAAAEFDQDDAMDDAMDDALNESDDEGKPGPQTESSRRAKPAEPTRPAAVHTPGDLRVPGAIGPETHSYGGMALHLYMRSRNEAPQPDPGSPVSHSGPDQETRP